MKVQNESKVEGTPFTPTLRNQSACTQNTLHMMNEESQENPTTRENKRHFYTFTFNQYTLHALLSSN